MAVINITICLIPGEQQEETYSMRKDLLMSVGMEGGNVVTVDG